MLYSFNSHPKEKGHRGQKSGSIVINTKNFIAVRYGILTEIEQMVSGVEKRGFK